jgi:hypothetical protein
MTRRPATLIATCLLCAVASAGLRAQSDPRLLTAVGLAQQGQGDSARAAVTAILNATAVTDPLYAEALYTLGRIAPNTAEMEKDMRRVAVEFAASAWADNALLQLAQLNYAAGDLASTERALEKLRSDYPTTDVLAPASLWAARAYFAQGNAAAGCDWLKAGIGAAGSDIELLNQLQFLNGRCAGVSDSAAQKGDTAPPARTDTTKPAPAPTPVRADSSKPRPAPVAAPAPPSGPVFSVQVASVGSDAQATSVAQMLTRDGFPPHIVKDADGSFKVRAGAFPTRAEADAYARKLRARYGAVFVVQERP